MGNVCTNPEPEAPEYVVRPGSSPKNSGRGGPSTSSATRKEPHGVKVPSDSHFAAPGSTQSGQSGGGSRVDDPGAAAKGGKAAAPTSPKSPAQEAIDRLPFAESGVGTGGMAKTPAPVAAGAPAAAARPGPAAAGGAAPGAAGLQGKMPALVAAGGAPAAAAAAPGPAVAGGAAPGTAAAGSAEVAGTAEKSAGHSGPPEVRRRRARIAEENYKKRSQFYMPTTAYYNFEYLDRSRQQAQIHLGVGNSNNAPNNAKNANGNKAAGNMGGGAGASSSSSPSPLKVSFSAWSTADALLYFASKDIANFKKVCGLNFANGVNMGGGYKTGALAQEEDLCRRMPNLYSSLYQAVRDGYYPFGPSTATGVQNPNRYSDVLFTPDLVIARQSEEHNFAWLHTKEMPTVSLVTAAAPNTNFSNDLRDLGLMYKTVQAVFIAPLVAEPQTETLILGAWGCGAFGGDPSEIGELFARAIRDGFGDGYREVHFAIPYGASDQNADTFRRCLRDYQIPFEEM